MSQAPRFQDILESKLQEKEAFSLGKSATFTRESPLPTAVGALLGHLETALWVPRSPYAKSKPTMAKPPRPSTPPPSFSSEEKESWQWFLTQGEDLGSRPSSLGLKKAYRRLALKLHPDRNQGQGELFLELKKHCLRLEGALRPAATQKTMSKE